MTSTPPATVLVLTSTLSNLVYPHHGVTVEGQQNSATVSYDSGTQLFRVSVSTTSGSSHVTRSLSTTVNLKPYFPAKPRIPLTVVIVSITIGGIILLGLFVWFMLRIRKSELEESIDEQPMISIIRDTIDVQFEKETGPRKFSYEELASATSNFDERKKLGEGEFGEVYRGLIDDLNQDVAVKKISPGSQQGPKEYAAEVKIISTLRHKNLVQLIGWCHENGEFLLVYNFIPNGSLDTHLFKETSMLSWEIRYKIVKELASVLFYLQEQCGYQYVVHRDIKSSNIMLDLDFTAKLGDFGLAQLVDNEQPLKTTKVAGTRGYMAPEYVTTKKATKKSDVFSFGIVALEIACGRRPIVYKPERGKSSIVEWVWELYGESKVIEAADPKLYREFDEKQIMHLMVVELWCAHPDPKDRASIEKAIEVLNFNAPLPDLPPKMPMATFPRT